MDTRAGAGFRSPLRYHHPESVLNGPGIPHYLDGCLLEFVDGGLSVIADDPEGGTDIYGCSFDFVTTPAAADIGTATASTDVTTAVTLVSNTDADPSFAFQNVVGGTLRIITATTTPADNDLAVLRCGAGVFRYSTTKAIWFVCRFAVQATNTGEQLLGLINTTYNPADPATLPTDGLFFSKATAATDFTFNVRNGGTSTTIANVLALASVTLTADTFVELAFREEAGGITVYVNGKRVGGIAAGTANLPATTTALQAVALVATSGAATKYMEIDHILAAEER